ncbi:MAG: Gfo/Idh/MocA family oxidoreductase [Aigarchaeota archaeon]|nr:Gfo/Idh/MocA family oxidoreductase [Aigarchaeota archaeon]MDW8092547.1 Gfo/Idh/MocA family oxidoreductase [Nitrososphaerota archaeon]
MDQREIRVGVIGTGWWGRHHVRVLGDLPGVVVGVICDLNPERAAEVAKRYSIKKYTRDYRAVLRDDEIDAVTICTPSITHSEICKEALRAGKDVLVEKPMAENVKSALEILDTVRSTGKSVMVGFIERFNAGVKYASNLMRENGIGEVLSIYGRRIGPWPVRIGDVGAVMDTAIHDIDLSIMMMGRIPSMIYAAGGSLRHIYEDHVQALLNFNDGKCAIIEANWLTPRKKRELRVTGSEGVVHIEFLTPEVTVERSNGSYVPNLTNEEPLRSELMHFTESLRRDIKPVPNEVDGLRALIVAESILNSMKSRHPVIVDELIAEYGVNLNRL